MRTGEGVCGGDDDGWMDFLRRLTPIMATMHYCIYCIHVKRPEVCAPGSKRFTSSSKSCTTSQHVFIVLAINEAKKRTSVWLTSTIYNRYFNDIHVWTVELTFI